MKEAGDSDSQTTLQKLLVVSSDDRDLAYEMLESDTSGPVSSRTRRKRREKSQKASRPTVQESGDVRETAGEAGGSGATSARNCLLRSVNII